MGITLAFLGAAAADVAGDPNTRSFTRPAFLGVLALEAGVSITGLASWAGDVLSLAEGIA